MLLKSVVNAVLFLFFFFFRVCVCTCVRVCEYVLCMDVCVCVYEYVHERKNIKRNDKLQISSLSIADYYPLLFRFVSLSLFIYPYDYP